MKVLKKAAVAAALALAGVTSFASTINVGGVNWDPDAATDFTSQSAAMRQFINVGTGELTGFGIINAMNGNAQATFCPGCELTFQFGGFMPTGGVLVPGAGQAVTYTGGWVKFYVDHTPDVANPFNYQSLTNANTGNGNLWLQAVNSGTFFGSNTANAVLGGIGFLDVVGGMAAGNFDTNQQTGGADFRFTTSFTFPNNGVIDMGGTGNLFGESIPEPTSLALIGLGLLGAGVASRKRAK